MSKSRETANRPVADGAEHADRTGHAPARPLRAAAECTPVRMVKRVFTLDHPLGETTVTVRGPAGAAKLLSSHTSLSISTDAEPAALAPAAARARSAPAAIRPLSGNPSEPGGTIEESLPGEDEGVAAAALTPDALSFLRGAERDMLRRGAQE